jgi:cytochrome c biogenesis protein
MSTTGIELNTRRRWLAETIELVSSMRFAISMLVIIAISAMIGTVMKQNDPSPNYINQFGPFWAAVFDRFCLYAVYSSWWFLLIFACLVTSTALCITRNGPKMMRDMRSWRDNVRADSLRNFHHKAEWIAPLPRPELALQSAQRLRDAGYRTKIVDKGQGTLIAAKKGAANKLGYIFAHSAIIIILLGGMLDSDLPIRFQEFFFGKTAFAGSGVIAQIPAIHRLSADNPTFRGNTMIPEGQASDTAIVARANGILIQPLPFTIKLNKFIIDFYSTGMPRLFASKIVVHDNETGKEFPATIEVNHPLIYRGVAVYQSSFEDGGSKLKLTGFPMSGTDNTAFNLAGEVNGTTALKQGGYTVEWSGFRPFNVENTQAGSDVRAVAKGQSFSQEFANGLDKHSGSAAKNANNKDLKNVGPSVQYKLRDKTGQAREYMNYMQPVMLDGAEVFLAGMRADPADNFSYLRIPADDQHSVREWMLLRGALADPALRTAAARAYAERVSPAGSAPELTAQLAASAARTLDIFAGQGGEGGFIGVAKFLEKVPAAEQERAADLFMKMLNGVMWELWQAAHAHAGLPPVTADQPHGRFLQLSLNALSDNVFYAAPVYLQLDDFTEVKASVLQVTRSPGKKVVYLGCILLVLGVFSMFYVRERRLWLWLTDDGAAGTRALMAMSTQRKTLDFEDEYKNLAAKLPQLA